jgi:hypothetical protein
MHAQLLPVADWLEGLVPITSSCCSRPEVP